MTFKLVPCGWYV